MVRTGDTSWFDDRCLVTYPAKQKVYSVWSRSRTPVDWKKYRVARRHVQHVYVEAERAFNESSRARLTNAPNPLKWWSTVRTAVFGA